MATQRLVRARRGRILGGVCRGLADFFGISVGWVRIGFLLFGIFGVGELVYLILWIVVPKADR
ncbi:MAG TPA: PspC domain-containing protein [Egibacteraceae bacterium]